MQQLNGGRTTSSSSHCASERLHAKLKKESGGSKSSDNNLAISSSSKPKDKSDIYTYYKVLLGDNRLKLNRKRKKRWLNGEVSENLC